MSGDLVEKNEGMPTSDRDPTSRRRRHSIGRVVRERLAQEIDAYLRADSTIDANDAHAVHQLRRATRRLRAALRLFRPNLDPLWTESLADELRWIAQALGDVRDLDVAGDRLFGESNDDSSLRDAYHETRESVRRALVEALSSRRRTMLAAKLREAARHPWIRGEPAKPARKRLPRRLESLLKRLKKAHVALRSAPSDDAYHLVRKRAKDLRLALELAAPDLGRRRAVERLDRALGRLVTLLGDRQDAIVARDLTGRLSAADSDVETHVASIDERQRADVERADREFRAAWREVRRRAAFLDP